MRSRPYSMTFAITVSRPGTFLSVSVAATSSGCWKCFGSRPGSLRSLRFLVSLIAATLHLGPKAIEHAFDLGEEPARGERRRVAARARVADAAARDEERIVAGLFGHRDQRVVVARRAHVRRDA